MKEIKVYYVAEDGTEFHSLKDCLEHEEYSKKYALHKYFESDAVTGFDFNGTYAKARLVESEAELKDFIFAYWYDEGEYVSQSEIESTPLESLVNLSPWIESVPESFPGWICMEWTDRECVTAKFYTLDSFLKEQEEFLSDMYCAKSIAEKEWQKKKTGPEIPHKKNTTFYRANGTVTTDPSKADYLICTTGMKWGGDGTQGCGTGESDANGAANTETVRTNSKGLWTTEGTIWKYCADMRAATGDDSWYVPAARELKDKHDSCSAFRPNGSVWSSSEYSANYAYYLNYFNGNLYRGNKHDATFVVLFRAS